MSGEAISSSILLIGAAIGAAFLVAAILPAIFSAGDTFGTVAHSSEEKLKTDFRITNTFAKAGVGSGEVKVWLKNVGGTRISSYEVQKSDVFYGVSTSISRYSYGGTPAFTYVIGDGSVDGSTYWDIGETLEIRLTSLTITADNVLYFTFSTPNSVRRTITFSVNN
ncbi:MAG TPA: flagellin [Methanospirillum sp.]|nr:flagellin [Methanospirillum sp.]